MPDAIETPATTEANGASGSADLGGSGKEAAAPVPAADNTPAAQDEASAPSANDAQKAQDGNSQPEPKSLLDDGQTGEPEDPLDQALTDLKDLDSSLWPDHAIDPDLLKSFGERAIKAGLSQRQARDLVAWQLEAISKARDAMFAQGVDSLKKEWGANAEQTRQDTLALISNIDRQLGEGGRFSKALNATGAGLNADIIAGLAKVAAMLGEDQLKATSSGAAPHKEETPLEGLYAAYREARQRDR